MSKKKKDQVVFVNINNYRGVKKVIKYLTTGNPYKNTSAYRKRKLNEFKSRLKPYMSKKDKMKLIEDFKRYSGVKKSGTISHKRRKGTIRHEGGNNYLIPIRDRIRKFNRGRKERIRSNTGESSGALMKGILEDYNVIAYFTEFASDIYPDWVERVRAKCADKVDDRIENMNGRQFIELCIELRNRYGG